MFLCIVGLAHANDPVTCDWGEYDLQCIFVFLCTTCLVYTHDPVKCDLGECDQQCSYYVFMCSRFGPYC